MNTKCPYCHNEKVHYPIQKIGDVFWCQLCAEPSFFNKQHVLRRPTKKELDKLYSDGSYQEHPNWLPTIDKKDIYFEVVIYDNGHHNPYHRDFSFAERFMTMMFHKFGIMPQVGDIIQDSESEKDGDEAYCIISKQWAVDDFSECKVYVIPEQKYFNKFS